MIDATKCEYEESSFNPEFGMTHYFIYPKDLDETEFYPEEDYGNVFCMCLSLSVFDNGEYALQMSPTVEGNDCLVDVDWRDLYEEINYTPETISQLLRKVKR